MKSGDGKSKRREEKRREGKGREGKGREGKRREEKRRRKKIQVCEKVAKSRNTVFFPMSCGSGRSKSRLTGGCEAMWSDER